MRRSIIFDVTVRGVLDAALVASVFLLFAGHNRPGGGFVGGLVAGSALGLAFVSTGPGSVDDLLPVRPRLLLSAGLLLVTATVVVPLFGGNAPLDHGLWSTELPIFGTVKIVGALPFDTGVYLIVVGMVTTVFEAIGPDVDRDEEPEP